MQKKLNDYLLIHISHRIRFNLFDKWCKSGLRYNKSHCRPSRRYTLVVFEMIYDSRISNNIHNRCTKELVRGNEREIYFLNEFFVQFINPVC